MAVDVAAPVTVPARFARAVALPAHAVLAALVAVSALGRFVAALGRETPYYVPDEYLYSAVAEGIAGSGVPSVRGVGAAFPALLEPLLTAPFWLTHDPELAAMLTQALHAVAVSVAAIPAYLLARRLGIGTGLALAVAGLAVAVPEATYASFLLADPLAYPFALGAVYAGVRALDERSTRWQLAFLGLAGLASLARVQYVVLPVALVFAGIVLDRRGAVRTLRPTLTLFGVAGAGVLAVGVTRALGYYERVLDLDVRALDLLQWAGRDAMVVAYAAAWVIVPGAVVGLALALARPRDRADRAFAAIAVAMTVFLVAQSALYETNAPNDAAARVHERYLFLVLPLLAVAFALWASRGAPRRGAVALLAIGFLAVSARVPLSGYTVAQGKADSPTLRAAFELEQLVGVADGALAVATAAAVLSLLAIAAAYRPARFVPVALALAFVVEGAIAAGAYSFDRTNAKEVRELVLPADRRWVDHAELGEVSLLMLPRAEAMDAFVQLYWNRSVRDVLLLGAPALDRYANERVRVPSDGSLRVDGRAVRTPLLVQTYGSQVLVAGAERVAATSTFELFRPVGTPRLRLLAAGFYADGRLAPGALVHVWDPGRLHLAFVADEPATVQVGDVRLALRPGVKRTLDIAVTTPVEIPVTTESAAVRVEKPSLR